MNPLPDNTQKGSVGAAGKTEFPPPCVNDTDPNAPPYHEREGLCSVCHP